MNESVKCKGLIFSFSITALLFKIISYIPWFLQYVRYVNKNGATDYVLEFVVPDTENLMYLIYSSVPYFLFLLCMILFCIKCKATVLYCVVCVLVAIVPYIGNSMGLTEYGGVISFTDILYLIYFVLFLLLAFDSLSGLSNKIFTVMATSVGFIINVFSVINLLEYISFLKEIEFSRKYMEYEAMFSVCGNIAGIIAISAFYLAILLFGLNNKIPAVLSVSLKKKETAPKEMTLEQKLVLLKEKHELGIITDEEYQAQRADIISKL